jgi:hypothetical protein
LVAAASPGPQTRRLAYFLLVRGGNVKPSNGEKARPKCAFWQPSGEPGLPPSGAAVWQARDRLRRLRSGLIFPRARSYGSQHKGEPGGALIIRFRKKEKKWHSVNRREKDTLDH